MPANPNLSLHTNGTDTEYEAILNSLRTSLLTIPAINRSKGGAIVFFKQKTPGQQDLIVKLFPLQLNQSWVTEQVFGEDQLAALFQQLNQDQPYQRLWHYKGFKENHGLGGHIFSRIPDEHVLEYNADSIRVQGQELAWPEFYQKVRANRIGKHTYEQLLFASGCREIAYIPLPVLSTPFVLLVLDHSAVKGELDMRLRQMYFRSRDGVSKYLYSTLIDGLTAYLEKFGETVTEEELVKQFVEELCHIFLPISYTINESAKVEYYPLWPSGETPSEYVLNLTGKKEYQIRFQLTSFGFPDFEHPDNNDWLPFHETQMYKSTINQSSLLVGKVFNLIHKYWSQIRAAEENTYKKITEEISHIDIDSLVLRVSQIRDRFSEMRAKVKDLSNPLPVNRLWCANGKVSLTVNREEIIVASEPLGPAQYRGFGYLQFIIESAKRKNYLYSIPVQELCMAVTPDVFTKSTGNEERKGLALQAALDLIEELKSFLHHEEPEIVQIVTAGKRSEKKAFNDLFYSMYRLHRYMESARVYQLAYEQDWGAKPVQALFEKLGRIYGSKRELDFREKWKQADVSNSTAGYDQHRRYLFPGDYVQSVVRNAFRALFQRVEKRLQDTDPEAYPKKRQAFEIFKANMVASQLMNPEKAEPASQTVYTYNQQGSKEFIAWETELPEK